MGTRSTIAIRNSDDSVSQIYCHWDGYLSHNGKILLENYTDVEKIQRLIGLGALSVLGEEIGFKVDFDDSVNGQCKAYHRDRGEELMINRYKSFADFKKNRQVEEYNYLFSGGKWLVDLGRHGAFIELSEAMEHDED